MDKPHRIKKGKFLALLLRHQPELGNLTLNKNGWAEVDKVLNVLEISLEDLNELVAWDDKGRYEFSIDVKFIRARQGHSIDIDVELGKYVPTGNLYHGTTFKALEIIKNTGLLPMSRLYVHLSQDQQTAIKVGSRKGPPLILIVDAVRAHQDGIPFWISNNHVVLTKEVPPQYITIVI